MSLTTRCPACDTTFRVVRDQLKLADGWVRCGRCGEVFEAAPTLSDEVAASAGSAGSDAADAPADAPLVAETSPRELPYSPASFPPGFIREAQSDARWSRPRVRIALAVASVLAALMLAVQVLVHERDRIAAAEPGLVPLLAAVCQPLGCVLSPQRRIDAIVIDASNLVRLGEAAYRLQLALRNTAAVEVAVPAIELTLTDAADQPVLRRVITPAELRAAPALAARSQWTTQVVLALAGDAQRVAGYRVLAFHP